MLTRFFLLPLSFAFLISIPCVAETVEVKTSEPLDTHLGMKIDLNGKKFVNRVTVDKDKFLLVDQTRTDVRISKDTKTNLNHFNALVYYNLYEHGLETSDTRFLYLQCPVVRETFASRIKPAEDKPNDGKSKSVYYTVDTETLKKEVVDPGFYKFLSLPDDNVPKLSNNFPMSGTVSEHFDMEIMCLQIRLIYAYYSIAEAHRRAVLKNLELD